MPKFAVYYVPEETDELYRLGSAVLGYDVRKRAGAATLERLRSIPGFNDQWVARARLYGFHLTIGDSIDFDPGEIGKIEAEIADILACFDPEHAFTLTRRGNDFIDFWGPAVVLRYEPNDYLKVLHAVIAARVHPLGKGSGYLQRYLANPTGAPHRSRRILKFFSPTIFDSYTPHFTLLSPYSGESRQEVAELFSEVFASFDEIVIHSICLLIQFAEGQNWQIHREFSLPETKEGIITNAA